MAEQATTILTQLQQAGDVIVKAFTVQIWQLFDSPDFWELHGNVLTLNWFVVAFVAILIKSKSQSGVALFLHTLLFIFCNISTLLVNFGAAYKVYPSLSDFENWSLLKKGHTITALVFSLLLIMEWLGGIGSMLGANSYYHKRLGRPITYLGMITAIFGMVFAKEQTKAAIFGVVFLVEILILRAAKPKEYQLKSKINKSIGELKTAKRD